MVRKPLLAVGCCILAFATSARGDDPPLPPGTHGEDSVAFAPHGKWVVTGGSDGRVRIRDGTTGVVLATLGGHGDDADVNAVAVSPDGRTIASASNDCSARLWDVERRTERRVLRVPRPPRGVPRMQQPSYCVLAVAFAPDGRTVVTGDYGGFARLWDVESGELRESWRADSKRVDQVLYSPDGKTIASAGNDPDVKLWDARSHELRRSLPQPGQFPPHLAYSPDGATLAVSRGSSITMWDPRTGAAKECLRDCPKYAHALAFTPDGDYLAVADLFGSQLGSVKPRADGDDRWTAILGPPYVETCSALAVSPDGRWVAHCFSTNTRRPTQPNFKLIAIR